jgi:adenylate kinase family enzyme
VTRVIVLGCAGSGKSSFARRLSERTGAPLIDLDALWRAQGEANLDRFRETLAQLHDGESWISDGNFSVATFDIRLPHADLVVWLDRSRLVCAWRAVRRVLGPDEPHHRLKDVGKVLAFIRDFDRKNRPLIEAERIRHGPDTPVVHLENDRATDAFLANAG